MAVWSVVAQVEWVEGQCELPCHQVSLQPQLSQELVECPWQCLVRQVQGSLGLRQLQLWGLDRHLRPVQPLLLVPGLLHAD